MIPKFEETGQSPYMGSLKKIGYDELDRKRLKEKEFSNKPFDCTILPDRGNIMTSNSIRTGKCLRGQMNLLQVSKDNAPPIFLKDVETIDEVVSQPSGLDTGLNLLNLENVSELPRQTSVQVRRIPKTSVTSKKNFEKAEKIYKMFQTNSNIVTNQKNPYKVFGKSSQNSYYQKLNNQFIDDNFIQMQINMPKNYPKTIEPHLIKNKV